MTVLKPGESTVADAASLYQVSIHRICATLKTSLTDVHVPPDGIAGVITRCGKRWAYVYTREGTEQYEAATLVLAADSIAVLIEYLPWPGQD